MSVRKRTWTTKTGEKKSAFVASYTDANGRRHIQTFEREKEAKAYHAQVAVNVAKGIHIAPSNSPTMREAAEAWIKRVEARGRERGTLRQYHQHVHLHIVPRLGTAKLAKLTTTAIDHFRDDLLRTMSRPMARKVMTSLRSILKVARMSHVAADVESIGKPKREAKLEIGKDFPTNAEIKRLVAAAGEGRERALMLTLALTGLRASEVRGLRWRDVDLSAAELHLRQRADRYQAIGTPKSDSSSRTIPLSHDLVSALKVWKLACPKGEADLVFPTSSGKVQTHNGLLRHAEAIERAAGVTKGGEPKYGLHAFRHWFASWCINSRAKGGRELPAKQVQALLGHSSIVITLDVYGHLFPDSGDRKELHEATSALLG